MTDEIIELEDKDLLPAAENALVPAPAVRWPFASGKVGWALLWLLGVPLPVLLVIWLLRGGH